jgi:hypothetical protein
MTPAELLATSQALAQAVAAQVRGYVPHTPHPKQAEFIALTDREALYGGAAGGGKSDALLMGALQHVHVPGYSALILRKTFRDLNQPDAIMARSKEWLRGTDAVWNDRDKRWTFPSGATLTFGYLDTEDDVYQYQGAAFQFIGFDELTQFPERPYRYLFSRLRRVKGVDLPLRMRAATNPGGIGHEWVRRRFIDPGDPARPFVPAKLVDNPSLDAEDYRASLAELDSTTRQQLEHGVWVRDAGGLVYRCEDARNVIDTAPVCDRKLLGLDFGVRDATAFVILGWRVGEPTVYVLKAWKRVDMIPSEAAAEIQELEAEHRFQKIVGDVGGLGKAFAEEARRRFHVPIEPAEKVNKLGYISLMNGDLERGRLKVVRAGCRPLLDEWAELPWDEERQKECEGFENHCADAALYGWRAANAFYAKDRDQGIELPPAIAAQRAHDAGKKKFLEGLAKDRARSERLGALPASHRRMR